MASNACVECCTIVLSIGLLLPFGHSCAGDESTGGDQERVRVLDQDDEPASAVDGGAVNPAALPLSCGGLLAKYRSCGLVSEGSFDCLSRDEPCVYLCEIRSDCDNLADWVCNGYYGESEVAFCLERCLTGGGGLICEDSGLPVTPDKYCDGVDDCADGSDEKGCPFYVCQEDWRTKIPAERVCDGVVDCKAWPNSDEQNCADFVCLDRTHIAHWNRCDGLPQCDDGSDEKGCPLFECADGQVISSRDRCDYDPDCADRSDEIGCPLSLNPDCPQGIVGEECELLHCGAGVAVYVHHLCDGKDDCPNGLDEEDCTYYECADNTRVPDSDVCDGYDDCPDGSDEEQGCVSDTFICADGGEASVDDLCDGFRDCDDWSDERDCCDAPPCAEYAQCEDALPQRD